MPSLSDVLALPYGETRPTGAPYDVEEILALDYSGNVPASQGLTSDDYRRQYAAHGETFRVWEAAPVTGGSNKSGLLFTEIELDDTARGYFYQTRREIEIEEFGLIPRGSTAFSVLPDVVELGENFRLLRTAQEWKGRAQITRGSGSTDSLPERFVTAITQVLLSGGSEAAADDVEAVSADSPDDDDLGGIQWLGNAPAAGTVYTVRFRYHPLFVCLGELIQGEPIGADGERLPQRVLLKKERD